MAIFNATTGLDNLVGGGGTDTFNVGSTTATLGDIYNGGGGTDTIVIGDSADVYLNLVTISGIENLTATSGADDIHMTMSQFFGFSSINMGSDSGGDDRLYLSFSGALDVSGLTLPTLLDIERSDIEGSTGDDTFTVTGSLLNSLLISGSATINLGTGTDTIILTSTSTDLNGLSDGELSGVEAISAAGAAAGVTISVSSQSEGFTLTGSSNDDTLTGGSGADTIDAGDGSDTINLSNGRFVAGESIDGGAATDAIVLTSNGTTVDFTTGSVSNVETLTGSNFSDTVTLSGTQWTGFTTINLGNGSSDTVNVVAGGDISGLGMPTVSNVEVGNLIGTAGDDSATLTGEQLDAILIGAGGIDLGAGTNTINVTSTSADLNGLLDGGLANVQAFSAAGAAAGVLINLSSQSEAFTLTGSIHSDSLYGGSGDDTFTGGEGTVDHIVGGAGNDTAVFSGAWVNYTITDNGGGSYTVVDNVGTDGTDNIEEVENFAFTNGTFTAADSVNDTPTDIALSANTVDENAANDTVIGSLTSTDADDLLGDTATYTLQDDAGGRFKIVGSDIVVADGTQLDYETNVSHNVTVRVTDAHGAFFDKVIAIDLNDLNAAPVITSGVSGTEAENTDISSAVYTVTATDDGENSGTLTYSLSAGGDNDLFDIDASTGEVTFKVSPDFEAPGDAGADNTYDITVHANDGTLDTTKDVAITVTDLNDVTPVITSGGTADFVENDTGTAYAATATDPDTVGSITWSLTGDDAALFDIDTNTGEVTFKAAPDFETPLDSGGDNVYDIVVHANDGINDGTQAVAITVTNVGAYIVGTAGDDIINNVTSPIGQPLATYEEDDIYGMAGNDTIDAGLGDDWVSGGAGADDMMGGPGNDTLNYANNAGALTIHLGNRTVSGGNADGDTFFGFENVFGTGGGDVMIGNSVANILAGNNGNDKLTGAAGDDTLDGGAGNDKLNGGTGADALLGGAGTDTAIYGSSTSGVTVDLLAGTGSGGEAAGDTLDSIENIIGSSHDDVLTGNTGANVLAGNNGDDTLDGGDGDDTVYGGAGADTLIGGNGVDTVDYSRNHGALVIDLENNTVTGGNATGDTISGFENVISSGGPDQIIGSSADNVISAGSGRDMLQGGAGADMLTGGGGRDTFVYTALTDSTVGAGHDTIVDFNQAAHDKIDLQAIDAVDGGADDAFTLIGNSAFTGAGLASAGELRFFTSGPDTLVQGDTNGDGVADFEIALNGNYVLAADDFIL